MMCGLSDGWACHKALKEREYRKCKGGNACEAFHPVATKELKEVVT